MLAFFNVFQRFLAFFIPKEHMRSEVQNFQKSVISRPYASGHEDTIRYRTAVSGNQKCNEENQFCDLGTEKRPQK